MQLAVPNHRQCKEGHQMRSEYPKIAADVDKIQAGESTHYSCRPKGMQ